MSLGTILYSIFITPIEIIYEVIFTTVFERFTGNYGITIIILSLAVNILVLPLYKRADAIQAEERDIEAKLKKGVDHIKKSFKGNEQTMILQAYYKENNYKPTYVIKGLLPLLLQIPFFMAAYNFLSNYEALKGVSFGLISNLGAPDQMLTVFGITINVLPILMTLINFISSYIYTKGFPLKNKIQLYGIAIIFLVLLYNSPAGLVFYWTLNNIFSLIKNIIGKLPNKKQVIKTSLLLIGILVALLALVLVDGVFAKTFICFIGLLLTIPFILSKTNKTNKKIIKEKDNSYKLFYSCTLYLAILTGLVIPSSVISTSAQEFVVINVIENPLLYLVNSFSVAIGMFVLWVGVFYLLANRKYKWVFDICIFAVCIIATTNYMFFGQNLGMLTTTLKYENGLVFSNIEKLLNVLVIVGILIVVGLFAQYLFKYFRSITIIGIVALIIISIININTINKNVAHINFDELHSNHLEGFELSKNGKNVVIITLDRAIGTYVPFMIKEKPELMEMFSGFTYYPNTISFGPMTNIASPAMFGGYEYTPLELNKRDQELLADKHNEALRVLPYLFDDNGYKVTVCDPPYAGYEDIPDLSIYRDSINAYLTNSKYFTTKDDREVLSNYRNFFRFGLMKTLPLVAQDLIYNKGNYNTKSLLTEQVLFNNQEAKGYKNAFIKNFNVLNSLDSLTKIKDDNRNTLLMLDNELTHEVMLLQKPDYMPTETVNNRNIDGDCYNNYIIGDLKLNMDNSIQIMHYHTNMCAMLTLGKWFNFLKENGVYDNTRIIVVSDHGRDLHQIDELVEGNSTGAGTNVYDFEFYLPLLMVKDFNAKEFTINEELMTNADVPYLATKELIENPINPFTGKVIDASQKEGKQYIYGSVIYDQYINNGTTFIPNGVWFSIVGNPYDINNWRKISEGTIFPTE